MSLRVGCGQFTVSSNVSHNFQIIKKLIHKSIQSKVQVLFLPEASDYLAKNATHSFDLSKLTYDHLVKKIQRELLNIYNNLDSSDPYRGLFVSIGIHEPDPVNSKTINKLLWINNMGDLVHEYLKIHLFDINIKNGPILKESDSVTSGNSILSPFEIPVQPEFKVGYQICYDIRFPELSTILFKEGANILTFPSAFTVKTGEAHWKTLGKARAIDNQSYVIMAAQCGHHKLTENDSDENILKRVSYGNSLIIDPWGEIVAQARKWDDELVTDEDGDYYELIVADLDYQRINEVRSNMPLLHHRRSDIYSVS